MSKTAVALTSTSLPLTLVAKGKVRDVYDAGITEGADKGALLFVATDRISAFDIILENGIPNKGKLLHALSTFWFQLLTPSIIESHIIATEYAQFPAQLQEKLQGVRDQVEGRSMLVKRAEVVPIEAIVRGYITGSGWKEYTKSGTVHGISLAKGLVESQEIPGGPLFTPSTKADQGQHDENIHPDKGESKESWEVTLPYSLLCSTSASKVSELVGEQLATSISKAAVSLYAKASQHAQSRGIILADTKFEFGLLNKTQLILVDEVLTPDSSRFWDAASYEAGRSQASFDKQYVRDWLKSKGLDKAADEGVPVTLPDDVVGKTAEKYQEAYERITGCKWQP